jgi:hypothetical protein
VGGDYADFLRSRDPVPTEQILEQLNFKKNNLGNYFRTWANLRVAALEWLGGYHFILTWASVDRRSAGQPELRVPAKVAPALLLAVLYDSSKDAFSKGGLPPELQIGKEELEYRRKTQALMPPPPTIWADRKFLRFCLSYVDRAADWSQDDYVLRLAFAGEQLRIQAKSQTVFCPARGNWLGASIVSARDLFRRIPKRFLSQVVALQQKGDALVIDRRTVKAKWEELNG